MLERLLNDTKARKEKQSERKIERERQRKKGIENEEKAEVEKKVRFHLLNKIHLIEFVVYYIGILYGDKDIFLIDYYYYAIVIRDRKKQWTKCKLTIFVIKHKKYRFDKK